MKKYQCETCSNVEKIMKIIDISEIKVETCITCGKPLLNIGQYEVVYEEIHGDSDSDVRIEKTKIVDSDELELIKIIEAIGNNPDGLLKFKEGTRHMAEEYFKLLDHEHLVALGWMDNQLPQGGECETLIEEYYRENFLVCDKTYSFDYAEVKFKEVREGVIPERKHKYIQKRIKVSDNWHPCYEGNEVRLKLGIIPYAKDKFFVRICVWGADDTGMEMDFDSNSWLELEAKFNEWKETIYDCIPEVTSKEYFESLGFRYA